MEKLNTQKVKDFIQSKKSAMVTTAIAVATGLSSYTAFAGKTAAKTADKTLATAMQTIAENFYSLLLTVANPIAIICGGLCFLTLFFNRNPQKKEMSYDWLKGIIFAFIAVNLLGLIISQISALTKDAGGGLKSLPWK